MSIKTARERAFEAPAAKAIQEYQDKHSQSWVRAPRSVAPQVIVALITIGMVASVYISAAHRLSY